MKTTNYILELLIAGMGTALWMLLLIAALVCSSMTDLIAAMKQVSSTHILLLSPLVYVIGVLADHLVDSLYNVLFIPSENSEEVAEETEVTKGFTERLRQLFRLRVHFNHIKEKKRHQKLRIKVFLNEQLKDEFAFRRTKIRLCRNWVVNGILSTISLMIFFINTPLSFPELITFRFLTILSLFSAVLAHYTWRDQVQKEESFLHNFGQIEKEKERLKVTN